MPRARFDLVGILIIRQSDPGGWQHLQLRRAANDYMGGQWSLCRGKIEPGETAMAAGLRELFEETSLIPSELYRLSTVEQFYIDADDTVWHAPFFAAVVQRGDPVALNEEHDAYRWVPDAEMDAAAAWASELPILAELRTFILADRPTRPLMRVALP